jgi:hypothetical protein
MAMAVDDAPMAMAVLLLNHADLKPSRSTAGNTAVTNVKNSTVTIQLSWVGYDNVTVAVRDLYLHEDLGTFTGSFTTDAFGAHDSRMYILTPTNATDEAAAANSNDTASSTVPDATSRDYYGHHSAFPLMPKGGRGRLLHSLDACTDRCLLLGHCNGIKDPTQGCDSKPSCAAGCAFAQVYSLSQTSSWPYFGTQFQTACSHIYLSSRQFVL